MKKILTLALAFALALSMAACGAKDKVQDAVKDAVSGTQGGNTASPGSDTGITQKDIEDANEAWSQLEEMFYAEDWRWDKEDDSGYINGKWDEGVMYDPVPAPPEGIQITEMQYTGKKSKKWNETATIGDMYIDGADYEHISVDFDCSKAQLEEMVKSYVAAGWLMHFEEDYGNGDMWHFYHGGDYYAFLRAGEYMAADGYEIGAYLNVTPAYYELPKTVAGVKMPQCGILFGAGWLDGYDKDYNHIEEEFSLDTPTSGLPVKWLFSNEDYYGVVADDLKVYCNEMTADGWDLAYEYEGGSDYSITLKKGDVRIQCSARGRYYMSIQMTNDDNLYY
jgi:hypothetical protein